MVEKLTEFETRNTKKESYWIQSWGLRRSVKGDWLVHGTSLNFASSLLDIRIINWATKSVAIKGGR